VDPGEFPLLLTRAQQGDADAFADLWRALNPPLLRYLRVVAPDAAEDLASETWLHACRALSRFQGEESGFRAWLFAIARNRVVDRGRWTARRPESPTADMTVLDSASSADTGQAALDELSTARALALIRQLPREQAEVVMLRVVVGLDASAVADLIGSTPGAVRVAGHRALRRLASILQAEAVTL
jgi:RNA polymerase sigma-70 factor (ECF subfamily)